MIIRVLKVSFFAMILAQLSLVKVASAQTVFMVQLGTFDSEQKAQKHWIKLSQAYPDLFKNLRYTPNEVVSRPDDFVSFRTQAGPIPTRGEAEALCDQMSESEYECYIVETAMFYSDDDQVTTIASTKAVPAEPEIIPAAVPTVSRPVPAVPVAAPKVVVPTQPVQQQAVHAVPAFVSQAPKVPAPSVAVPTPDTAYAAPKAVAIPALPPQAVASSATLSVPATPAIAVDTPIAGSSRGNIAVAEAIPVPLSQSREANPYLERGNRLMDAHPSSNERINSFWADISYFRNEAEAMRYVQLLKSRDSLLPSKLRIRITRPYGNVRGERRLSLRMGPFMTTRPVRRLCALTRAENMRCRAIKDVGGSVRYKGKQVSRRAIQSSGSSAKTRYGEYRGKAAIKANQTLRRNSGTGSYYVQLGSFLSPEAAEDKWGELKSLHGRSLSKAAKDISAPARGSASSRLFRLRTGPHQTYAKAKEQCNALKRQGTLCLVVKR